MFASSTKAVTNFSSRCWIVKSSRGTKKVWRCSCRLLLRRWGGVRFSKSHSVICFSIGQIKQTFCIFCTCKRYACCLFCGIQNNYTHTNIKQPTWLTNIRMTEAKSWGRLEMSERSVTASKKTECHKHVGNVTLVHFFLNQQRCFEKLLQWN